MSPIGHPLLDTFLLGFIAACSLGATVFFIRFWMTTRDPLFLAFAFFFATQGGTEAAVLTLSHPNIGTVPLFVLRFASVLAVLAAIAWKNFGTSSTPER